MLVGGTGDAVAYELVVAASAGAVIDENEVLVLSLIFVTIDDSGLPYVIAIRHPKILVIVGSLLEQQVVDITS